MKYFLSTLGIVFAVFFSFVPQAHALNQSSNWSFTGNATNWDATNGTGTDVCGQTTSATETNLNIQAYDNNNYKAAENTASNNVQERGRITQNITIPGSGSQNVKGGLTYSTTGSIWSSANTSWVRMDIYNSADSSFVANIGCTSFNTNLATTTFGFAQPVVLTGGTSYKIRITQKLRNVATDGVQNLWVDDVVLTTPPVNPAVSAPANTKNASLTWDVSTATSTAPSIHASTPYKVYRGTSSGSETFLANATTNAYTDSSTVGNTTYYYWLTNLDTQSYESASSTEASLLTQPDAPTTPTFSSVTDTTMTVLWDPPTGGASTYDVERCTGAACNSGWTTRSTAQAGVSFNDSGLSPSTTYGYRIVGNNATGAGVYSATGYQATNAPPVAPTVSTQAAGSVTATTAILNGTIEATGGANATVRGFAWGTNANLSGGDTATTSNDTGSFSTGSFNTNPSPFTGLFCNTTYYSRAYATNSAGTGLGEISAPFTTTACVPTVSTQSASGVGQTSATLNGTIEATGGANATVRGFAWGTNANLSGGDTATTSDTVGQPFGTGTFTESSLTLICNTTYYSRAYATNSAGKGYGEISASFSTSSCDGPPEPPRVMRLFEGFRVKFVSGRIIFNQR